MDLLKLIEFLKAQGETVNDTPAPPAWDGKFHLFCENRLSDAEREVEQIEDALFMGAVKSSIDQERYCIAGLNPSHPSPILVILYPPQKREGSP